MDQILFLYRDNYYDYESDASAELIVGKSLMGQTGTVTLEWAYTTGCFRELQK